ncbi:hypothetical protein CH63R_04424 [Colletotrichum higginsianum IMI 349063]|uniref:Uncharacterized protein n=1 Tax=Colletotrichum higginsianum (strain IMI 349063) TaxID=759273 RepID=A0A1B7YJV0_COLHI|nr:hypothetical protein CH63R_04424 [Colletotrichum higginsianum IMI 349063]OBR12128.1 hypothetical protein CH63R_04424 [Colletotrichum higginsianum IMI 349063]
MESEKSFCHCSRNSHLQTPNLLAFTTLSSTKVLCSPLAKHDVCPVVLLTRSFRYGPYQERADRASGRKGNRAHRRIRMLGSCGSLVHISGDKSHYGTDIPAFNMCSKFVEGVGMGPTFARFRHDDGDRAW